ncbi:hypothetical protein A0H81_13853 [Grifola frondosa]|uniref:Uncharacterized protein n=1 Tax=Grifola frondosa TaxID=5627 RepID=A0A1C7LP65_GRIFR|nr:hypothetical protein A0H81_13853 [Grifola frondosa]
MYIGYVSCSHEQNSTLAAAAPSHCLDLLVHPFDRPGDTTFDGDAVAKGYVARKRIRRNIDRRNSLLSSTVATHGMFKSAVSAVPFLSCVVSSVLSLVKAIEKANDDRDRYIRLADLSRHLEENISADPDAVDGRLRINLVAIQSTVTHTRHDIEKRAHKSLFKRIIHHASLSQALDVHLETSEFDWRSFDFDHHQRKYDSSVRVRDQPNVHHPYVAQPLGCSHLSISEKIYVMERAILEGNT